MQISNKSDMWKDNIGKGGVSRLVKKSGRTSVALIIRGRGVWYYTISVINVWRFWVCFRFWWYQAFSPSRQAIITRLSWCTTGDCWAISNSLKNGRSQSVTWLVWANEIHSDAKKLWLVTSWKALLMYIHTYSEKIIIIHPLFWWLPSSPPQFAFVIDQS